MHKPSLTKKTDQRLQDVRKKAIDWLEKVQFSRPMIVRLGRLRVNNKQGGRSQIQRILQRKLGSVRGDLIDLSDAPLQRILLNLYGKKDAVINVRHPDVESIGIVGTLEVAFRRDIDDWSGEEQEPKQVQEWKEELAKIVDEITEVKEIIEQERCLELERILHDANQQIEIAKKSLDHLSHYLYSKENSLHTTPMLERFINQLKIHFLGIEHYNQRQTILKSIHQLLTESCAENKSCQRLPAILEQVQNIEKITCKEMLQTWKVLEPLVINQLSVFQKILKKTNFSPFTTQELQGPASKVLQRLRFRFEQMGFCNSLGEIDWNAFPSQMQPHAKRLFSAFSFIAGNTNSNGVNLK